MVFRSLRRGALRLARRVEHPLDIVAWLIPRGPSRREKPLVIRGIGLARSWLHPLACRRESSRHTTPSPYTAKGFLYLVGACTHQSGYWPTPKFAIRLTPKRIGSAGFSLGGYTMIAIAGGNHGRAGIYTFLRLTECRSDLHQTSRVSLAG